MKHTWIVAALLLAGPAFAGDTSKIQTYQLKIEPLPEHSNCTQGAMDVQGNCIFPWPKETQKAPDAGKYMVDVGRQRVAEWHVLVINMSGSGMPLDGAAVIADEGFSMCGPLVFRDPKKHDVLRLAAGECLPASKPPVAGEKK